MARKEPYIEDSVDKLKQAILSKTRENLSENYSQSLRDLVDKFLNTDPDSRPTIEQVLRYPVVRAELTNILNDFLPLTYNYPTSMSAHLVIEQVIEIQCMLAKSTDYGLFVTDPSLIRVANTPNTQFLLQAELRAIQNGLQYVEDEDTDGNTYNGYFKDGKAEGVGITTFTDGQKDIAEYHLDKCNGCVKTEFANGNKFWGEYKDDKKEGYGIFEWANGDRYIGQWMKKNMHGYGIFRWASGEVYYGQRKENKKEGYAYWKASNGTEYYGQWKNGKRNGDAVLIENGQLYSCKYEEDKIITKTKYNV
jgi:hypothetical protein